MRRIAIAAVAVLALAGCAEDRAPGGDRVDQREITGDVDIVTLKGMTCLVWDSDGYVGGLTCDWSEYEGDD